MAENVIRLRNEPAGGDSYDEVTDENPFPVKIIELPGIDLQFDPVPRYSYVNMTTQTTKLVKTGIGVLHTITFGLALASGVVTIYDALSAVSTAKIGTITFPGTLLTDVATYTYDVQFNTGLTIVTSGATQDITIAFQ